MDEGPLIAEARAELLKRTHHLSRLPDSVWKRTSALDTWGTNAIEGNALTDEDVERLLMREESVGSRPIRDVVETIQHERAFARLLQRRAEPLSLVTVLELHEEVFRGLAHARPGQWRTGNVFIAGSKHRPPRAEKVISSLDAWLASYRRKVRAGEHPLMVGAWMHHAFEAIHPFEDGNGRAGRLILNLHLLSCDWPPVHVVPQDRERYLGALEAANAGVTAPLEDYVRVLAGRSLLDLLDQVGGAKDELKELRAFEGEPWCPYGHRYLALRAKQEALVAVPSYATSAPPALHRKPGRARWLTSERAARSYVKTRGR